MLELRKMTEDEFLFFRERAITHYAADLIRAGNLPSLDAQKIAEDAFKVPLAQGIHSTDHFLFSIFESKGDTKVGNLWLGKRKTGTKESAFIFDIFLEEKFRGRGYGEATMKLAETEARKLGLNSIGLHVFAHNQVAKSLYDKLGFTVTNIMMKKEL